MRPPETGRGEGRDASKARFSGQSARGPALCEPIASTEGEAPTGGAFAAPAGWSTAEALRRGYGPAWRAGRPGVRRWRRPPWRGGQRRRRRAEQLARCPVVHGASSGLPKSSWGACSCHHWGSAMATWKPCFGPAEPAAGADGPGSLAPLGSPARGTPARALGGGGVWGRGCDVHTWKGSR